MKRVPNKPPIIYECGHAKSRHWSVMARLVGCKVITATGITDEPERSCRCNRSAERVERDFGPPHPTDPEQKEITP